MPYFAQQRKDSSETILTSDQLASNLFAQVCKGSERQYLIIDGIDECLPDQRQKILKCLTKASSECETNDPGKLRILIISQTEKDTIRLLGNAAEVSISEGQNWQNLQRDIASYVEKRADDIKQKYMLDEAKCQMFNMQLAEFHDYMTLITHTANGS